VKGGEERERERERERRMNRLFGSSKKTPAPSLNDTLSTVPYRILFL
jgi:hypothetical protein